MRRLAFLVVLLTASPTLAADLPPGALVRLGDDRFRAGGEIEHLAMSPDGTQFVTVHPSGCATRILTVWDAVSGVPLRAQELNDHLFQGIVWGPNGGFAIVLRGEMPQGKNRGKVVPDDFRVWKFSDPKAKAPPLLPANQVGLSGFSGVDAEWPDRGAKYTSFQMSADGGRIAAALKTAEDKCAVHVFELNQTDTTAKLKRVGTLDLGAEDVDEVRIAADGKTVVTFRRLAGDGEMTATTWDVVTGKPKKPLLTPFAHRLMLAPDARSLIVFAEKSGEWGFDQYDLATGEKRQLTRWKQVSDQDSDTRFSDHGGFIFAPSGRDLVVAVVSDDWKTCVIDLKTGKERGRFGGHSGRSVVPGLQTAISADETRIATADAWGLIRIWDAKTLRVINEAPGHRAPVRYAQLSPDGKRLLTWATDETVRLWDVATGKELRAFAGVPGPYGPLDSEHGGHPTFTPDGTTILYSTEKHLIARDLQTGLEVPLPGKMNELEPRAAVFAPDGKSVLTWAKAEPRRITCEVWSWPDGQKLTSWDADAEDFAPGFSPDGAVIFSYPTSPERRDAKTGKELPPAWKDNREVNHELATLASLRPNPQWLIHNAEDASHVIEAGTGKRVTRFRLALPISGLDLAFSSTGGQYACKQSFQIEKLIRYQKGEQLLIAPPPLGEVTVLFEVATGHVRRELRGHRGEVRVLGFTPDGTKLLTAGGDHTVLVWDMRLAHVPLPEAVKKETDAAKLWNTLATGNAKDAYLAMARLAREPDAAVRMAKLKLKPVAKPVGETDAAKLTDARAIELLEALETDDSRSLLKELAGGHADAFRTQEAKRAMERLEIVKRKQ